MIVTPLMTGRKDDLLYPVVDKYSTVWWDGRIKECR